MKYPINFSFKLLAIASQIYIRDANGTLLGYVKQKLFKMKEDINLYADENQTGLLFNIKADRILDFSAKYNFTDPQGRFIGSVRRKGMRSIFKARYDISDERDVQVMKINEENGWIKVVDSLIGEVPIVGMFTGYFFNPAYIVARMDDVPVARLKKQPAFFEGKFELSKLADLTGEEENLVMLSLLMTMLLEKTRG